MKLAILGSGSIVFELVNNLHKTKGVELIVIGVDSTERCFGIQLKNFALTNNIPFINHFTELDKYEFDIILLLNYPILIHNEYLSKYRFLNIHYTLLPKYRGYHGFIWSIINGESKTGYTLHQVSDGIDNGPIYYQFITEISNNDDVISILERIEKDIIKNTLKVLLEIHNGIRIAMPQDEMNAIYVCKRKPEDGLIDWNMSNIQVYNFIRALKPPVTPGAYTLLKGNKIVIINAELWNSPNYLSVTGQVVAKIPKKGVLVKCGDGLLLIKGIIVDNIELDSYEFFKTVGSRFDKKL